MRGSSWAVDGFPIYTLTAAPGATAWAHSISSSASISSPVMPGLVPSAWIRVTLAAGIAKFVSKSVTAALK